MINLLPEEAIDKIKKRYYTKLLSVALFLLSGIIAVSIVFLLPSLFVSKLRLELAKDALAEARSRPVSKQAESLVISAKTINQRIALVSANESETSLGMVIDKILSYKKVGLSFSHFELSGAEVVLKGRARTRDDFLNLSINLKNDTFFSEVASPISNLIATSSLDFSIRMKIAPKQ